MINIILFGPPGSGKGTQAEEIIKKFGLHPIGTGDLFRAEMAAGTELGKSIKEKMSTGVLIDDDTTINLVQQEMNRYPNSNGFLLDGFPRNKNQAIKLDILLSEKGKTINRVLSLDNVREDELIRRVLARGKVSGRADDQNQDVILKRIRTYNTETLNVKVHYSAAHKVTCVDGSLSPEEVTKAIYTILDECFSAPVV